MCKVYALTIFAVVYIAAVSANDLRLGTVRPTSRKIYSQIKESTPILWEGSDDLTVTALDRGDVISAIFVTDMREDKANDVRIMSGGIGNREVTLRFSSATIFSQAKFLVEVYEDDPSNLRELVELEDKMKANA